VLLRKACSYAEVYNDLDGEIVNLFRVARDQGEELRRLVELTPFARADYEEAWGESQEPLERARRLLIRAFMGHGSSGATTSSRHGKPGTGFRNNTTRSGTTPAGDWRGFPEALTAITERLRGVVIEKKEAAEVIRTFDGMETLFYVDPPYPTSTRSDARPDYRFELTDAQHMDLAAVLHAVEGRVVLSGYACEMYESLFTGWHRVEKATTADGAAPRTEVLWMNFEPEGRLL
jgi:DNA adenine methylase